MSEGGAVVHAVVLAAGFGTRLRRTMEADTSGTFEHLVNVPKPLLPLGSSTIVEQWVDDFWTCVGPRGGIVCVATNAAHAEQYEKVLMVRQEEHAGGGGGRRVRLTVNGAMKNEEREGAVADLMTAVDLLLPLGSQPPRAFLVVAGDTLLPPQVHSDLPLLLNRFLSSSDACHTVGYPMDDPVRQCSSRGLLVLDPHDDRVLRFDEKPPVPPAEPCLASAPLYIMDSRAIQQMRLFLKQKRDAGAPLESYDAPGFFMKHLVDVGLPVRCLRVDSRIDIGTLEDYKDALKLRGSSDPSLAAEPKTLG